MYLTTVKAGENLDGMENKCVKYDADGNIVLAGAGDEAVGQLSALLGSNPAGNVACSVVFAGGAFGIAAATIVSGDFLKPDANGDLIPATADGDFYVGRAADNAVAGDCFEVIVGVGFRGA